jgi:uncharacterized protein (UPF0212 family)
LIDRSAVRAAWMVEKKEHDADALRRELTAAGTARSAGGVGVHPSAPVTVDAPPLRTAARRLEERLQVVKIYAAGGCPTCNEAEARAFVAELRRLADEAERGATGRRSPAARCASARTRAPEPAMAVDSPHRAGPGLGRTV